MTNTKPLIKEQRWAQEPHARLDQMAVVFSDLIKRLDLLEAKLTQRNQRLEQWSQDLHNKMGELETSIAHAGDVERQLKDEILAQKSKIPPLQDTLDELDAQFMLEVSAALDENGKPMYKNEDMRTAAVTLARANNEHYQSALGQKRAAEFAISRKQHELDEIAKDDKANRALYHGYKSRLENLTARF